MKNRVKIILVAGLIAAMLAGCSTGNNSTKDTANGTSANSSQMPSATTQNDNSIVEPITDYYTATKITLTDGKDHNITKGGKYSISGTLSNGNVVVDTTDKVYLEFAGVNITNSKGPALQINNAKKITLTLREGTENSLTDGGDNEINAALFSNDTLLIEGNGKLTITGNNEHAIESDDDVVINSGVVVLSAKNDGIHANDNITINGGEVTIKTAVEGIESKGDIVINDGSLNISASDDGLNAATGITINGGKVYAVSSQADALDSNGTINIAGGVTILQGSRQPEGGIDCDQNNLTITGGTLLAMGGSNSTPTEATCTQNTVMLGVTSQNGIINIQGDDGSVATFKVGQNAQSIVFSSPNLKSNQTYKVYTGGSVAGGSDFNGLYNGETYSGGSETASFTTSKIVTIQGGSFGPGGGGGKGGRFNNGGDRPNGVKPNNGEKPKNSNLKG